MSDTLTLYGFGVNDRSGKVRWLVHELGIPLDDQRIRPGDHYKPPYTELNPYGMVPTVQWRGQTMIESTATCTFLAEQFPDAGIVVQPGEEARYDYLKWVALFAETLEAKLVERLLAQYEMLPPAFLETTKNALDRRFPVMVSQLPESGFLVADRFTLADIEASYSLRLAIRAGRISLDEVGGYLRPLMERPAAKASGFFSAIEE